MLLVYGYVILTHSHPTPVLKLWVLLVYGYVVSTYWHKHPTPVLKLGVLLAYGYVVSIYWHILAHKHPTVRKLGMLLVDGCNKHILHTQHPVLKLWVLRVSGYVISTYWHKSTPPF